MSPIMSSVQPGFIVTKHLNRFHDTPVIHDWVTDNVGKLRSSCLAYDTNPPRFPTKLDTHKDVAENSCSR